MSNTALQLSQVNTCYILGIPTTTQTLAEAVQQILAWVDMELSAPKTVVACPVYTLMRAYEDPNIKQTLQMADMVAADGMPIVWMQQRLGYTCSERVYGPDLMTAICVRREIRHYFWGGQTGIADRLAQRLKARYLGLQVVGTHSPPIAPSDAHPQLDVIERINQTKPDIVWVGLGSPKQDLWAKLYAPHLNAKVVIGVGAAFDFLSGNKRQAPRWMRQHGWEWLFRLGQEPRRLGKRYLLYNSKFIYQIIRHYGLPLALSHSAGRPISDGQSPLASTKGTGQV